MEVTGRLAPGVAHELNNPLAAILGFSQLIRGDPSLPEDLRHNADLLVAEAERTRQIAGNLLDFLAHRPPERHPTSIRALIDSVLSLQAGSSSVPARSRSRSTSPTTSRRSSSIAASSSRSSST